MADLKLALIHPSRKFPSFFGQQYNNTLNIVLYRRRVDISGEEVVTLVLCRRLQAQQGDVGAEVEGESEDGEAATVHSAMQRSEGGSQSWLGSILDTVSEDTEDTAHMYQ